MKKQFHVVLTQATQYLVRTMDIDQIHEAIRDGFSVEPQGYEGRRILDEFLKACQENINEANEMLLDYEHQWEKAQEVLNKYDQTGDDKFFNEYLNLSWDPSDQYEIDSANHIINYYADVISWFEHNEGFNICRTIEEEELANKEYGALDQMSKLYLNNLDNESEFPNRNKMWNELEIERLTVREKANALSELRKYLEYGELI